MEGASGAAAIDEEDKITRRRLLDTQAQSSTRSASEGVYSQDWGGIVEGSKSPTAHTQRTILEGSKSAVEDRPEEDHFISKDSHSEEAAAHRRILGEQSDPEDRSGAGTRDSQRDYEAIKRPGSGQSLDQIRGGGGPMAAQANGRESRRGKGRAVPKTGPKIGPKRAPEHLLQVLAMESREQSLSGHAQNVPPGGRVGAAAPAAAVPAAEAAAAAAAAVAPTPAVGGSVSSSWTLPGRLLNSSAELLSR